MIIVEIALSCWVCGQMLSFLLAHMNTGQQGVGTTITPIRTAEHTATNMHTARVVRQQAALSLKGFWAAPSGKG